MLKNHKISILSDSVRTFFSYSKLRFHVGFIKYNLDSFFLDFFDCFLFYFNEKKKLIKSEKKNIFYIIFFVV